MSAGNLVMLRAGSLRLLLPQQDVGAAEYIEEAPRPLPDAGWFEYGRGEGACPVLALSGQMTPLAAFPNDRFVLTRLSVEGNDLYFAWSEVRVLLEAQLQPRPLPPSMRTPDGPITGYVHHGAEVLLCSTAGRVLAYAASRGS